MDEKKYQKIHEYLRLTGMSRIKFANLIKVSYLTLYRWLEGKNQMSSRHASKIEKETKGRIKASDLVSENSEILGKEE